MKSKFCTGASFLILFSVLHSGLTLTCNRLGSVCSKDCKQILVCTEINEEALDTIDCEEKSFCEETEDGATCDATSAQCRATSVNVICGSEGRFPHPTQANAFVRCPEELKAPSQICTCLPGKVVDRNDVTVPCINETEGGTSALADCDEANFGSLGDKFSYFCKGSDEVIVFLTAVRRKSSLISTRADFQCSPYTSGGSNTNPPENSEPTEPATTPTEPTKPTEPSQPTDPTKPTDPSTDPNDPNNPGTTPTPPPPPTTVIPEIKCSRKGEYHADPNDCHRYYFCKSETEPVRRPCPAGTYFHKRAKICLEGTCTNP